MADCLGLNDLSRVHPLEKKNDFLSLSSRYLPVALPLGVEPVRCPSSTLDINCYCLYADLAWKMLRFHGYSSLSRRCLAVNGPLPLKVFSTPSPLGSMISLSCNVPWALIVGVVYQLGRDTPPDHLLSVFWPVVVFCDCTAKRSFFDKRWELLFVYKDRYFI